MVFIFRRYYVQHISSSVWLAALLLAHCCTSEARTLRKVHATIPYTIEGKQIVIGVDGKLWRYGLGAQVVFHHSLFDSRCVGCCSWLLLLLLQSTAKSLC